MHAYVDFKTFVSIIHFLKYQNLKLNLNLRYRKPRRCVGAIRRSNVNILLVDFN